MKEDFDVTLIAVHPQKETKQGILIIPFRRMKNKALRVLITWLIMFFKAMKVNAKIYQLHDPELIPCGLLLKLFGKKVIFDLHENVAEDIFDKPWIKNKKLLFAFFLFFEKMAVKHFFLFLAEKSYEERYKKLGANYRVVLNYYDPEFFKEFTHNSARTGNRIFYIGILLESRGILEIAESVWILKQKGLEVHFDIVGELYSDLDVKIQHLPFYNQIQNQLHFYGRLPLEQGYEMSKNAAAGMCIIHPMKNSIGSYPTKMFEYMAIGLPQIISNFPLYESVVEQDQCGICVNPYDSQEIASAIQAILTNPQLANNMRLHGIENAKKYTWNSQYKIALAAYNSLLST